MNHMTFNDGSGCPRSRGNLIQKLDRDRLSEALAHEHKDRVTGFKDAPAIVAGRVAGLDALVVLNISGAVKQHAMGEQDNG